MAIILITTPSDGARNLSQHINEVIKTTCVRVHPGRMQARPYRSLLVNWGTTIGEAAVTRAVQMDGQFLNKPAAVRVARDKVLTLIALEEAEVPCLEFTTTKAEALEMWPGKRVIIRHTTTGQAGAGIQVGEATEALIEAPLYTRYFPKENEYRVFVVRDKAMMVKKYLPPEARVEGRTVEQRTVRSGANGWRFITTDQKQAILDLGIAAVKTVGLDFGAVDILESEKGAAVVCEINTRPGVENTNTKEFFANAFNEIDATLVRPARQPRRINRDRRRVNRRAA